MCLFYKHVPLAIIFFASFNLFANPCERFIEPSHFDTVQPIKLDTNICLIDKSFLKFTQYDAKQTVDFEEFGQVQVLSGNGEQFAIVTDVLSLLPQSEISEIRPSFFSIAAAIGTCLANPSCRDVVMREGWKVLKTVAGWIAGGYFWDEIKDRF